MASLFFDPGYFLFLAPQQNFTRLINNFPEKRDLSAKKIKHRLIFEQLLSEVIVSRVSRAQDCCCLLVLPLQTINKISAMV